MNKFVCLLLTLLNAPLIFGQLDLQNKRDWPALPNSPNYYTVRENYINYLYSLEMESGLLGMDLGADDLWTKFMRWDHIMKTRVDADGNYPKPGWLFEETTRYMNSHKAFYEEGSRSAGWEPVGTAEVPGSGGGVGRVNVILLDPVDPNILYAGSAGGGLWRSQDLGGTWIPLTDNIPVTGIADVAVDPSNNHVIYIATGDGYGYEASWQADNDFWGGVYSAGVFKSVDNGLTWLPTGLSYLQQDLLIIQRLIVHPTNTNILLAATRDGIYRTTDGGDNWTLVEEKHCYDFAFKTTDDNTIYAVGEMDVLISTDAGENWTILKNNLFGLNDRMSIETTADNPNVIYVFGAGASIRKSSDGGTSWTSSSVPFDVNTYYGYYDNVLGVSPLDEQLLYTGGLDLARSTNSGSTWVRKSSWWNWGTSEYVHADFKGIICDPANVNTLYVCNDGGVFKSINKGESWVDISAGLRVGQIYRISPSFTDPQQVLSGWQDNGCNRWDGASWDRVQGGDGMDVVIDHALESRIYASYQYGDLWRSINNGASWTDCGNTGGPWLTPVTMDPNDHLVMYAGRSDGQIDKSTNGGTSWTMLNSGLGGELFEIAVAPGNSNYVYACALQQIKVSTNGGTTWSNITSGLPTGGVGFNYIAVSDENPQHVWVAISGYNDGEKVFYSNNAGSSWTNISGTLPNVPVNTIVYENVSETDRVYIGTDIGVFTKDNVAGDWEPYMTGLPNVMVHELVINYSDSKLYAATYGRSVWKSDLYNYAAPSLTVSVPGTTFCLNQTVNIAYTAVGSFTAGNVFAIELSDETGAFADPVTIGSVTSTALTGNITCIIPAATVLGSDYRMRATSTQQEYIGLKNGSDLSIVCSKPINVETATINPTSVTLTWDASLCGVAYEVEYKQVAAATWTVVSTLTNSITITDLVPNTAYEWAVRTICVESPLVQSSYTSIEDFVTGQSNVQIIPGLSHIAIFPNPVTTTASVEIVLTQTTDLSIELLDILGQSISVLVDDKLNAGSHTFELNRNQLTSGVYTLQITSGKNVVAKNIVIE